MIPFIQSARSKASWMVAVLPVLATMTSAVAQDAPQVTPRDLRPAPASAPPVAVPLPAPATAPAGSANLFVRVADIELIDGFAELALASRALIVPMLDQQLSVADFYKLAEAIEQLYRDAGYALIRVTAPPQQLNDGGTLRLLVVDGFIERVDLSGVPEASRAVVDATLAPLVGRRRLSNQELERALTLAGRAPGLALRSALAAGTQAGGVVLAVEGRFSALMGSLSIDNRLSDTLGPWQSALQLRLNQPLGRGEQFYGYFAGGVNLARLLHSDAARRVAGGGVIIPLGANGLALNPEYTLSDTNTPGQFFLPPTRSEFERATLRLSYPLIMQRGNELNLTGAFEMANQRNSAPDFGLLLNHDKLRVLRASADWNYAAGPSALRMSTTLSRGLKALGARSENDAVASGVPLSRFGATPAFTKLEWGASFATPLGAGLQSRSTLRAQKAFDTLPSAEVFSLEGEDALSTFTAGALSNDSGWTLRQEFARPVAFSLGGQELPLAPYVFYAAGKARPKVGLAANGLSRSYGVGLRSVLGPVSLAMEWGRRTTRPNALDDSQFFLKGQVQF